MRTGIFGGTFSPPHLGHVHAAREFLRGLSLDRLYIIPAGIPPHKIVPKSDDPQLRLEMARLAFASIGDERIRVSDIELRRTGKSYTYDTLMSFENEGELFLLCGTDMLMCFESWYRYRDILSMCTLVVCLRDATSQEEMKAINEKINGLESTANARIILLPCEAFPVSSTQVRDMIRHGEDAGKYLCGDVYGFIKEKGLYRDEP